MRCLSQEVFTLPLLVQVTDTQEGMLTGDKDRWSGSVTVISGCMWVQLTKNACAHECVLTCACTHTPWGVVSEEADLTQAGLDRQEGRTDKKVGESVLRIERKQVAKGFAKMHHDNIFPNILDFPPCEQKALSAVLLIGEDLEGSGPVPSFL